MREEIDCNEHKIPEMEHLEAICVKFPLRKGNLFIYCLYIQPDANLDSYKQHINAIKNLRISSDDFVVIAGDFNLSIIKWEINDDNFDYIPMIGESESRAAVIAKFVTDELLEAGFFQMNNAKNQAGNVLDLIYTNSPELTVVEITPKRLISENSSDKAHNPLCISIECEPKIMKSDDSSFQSYCFRKANYGNIRSHLENINFDNIFNMENAENIDEILLNFYNVIYDTFDKFVPKATIRPTNNPKWFTKELVNLKNKRNRAYKKLCERKKSDPSADDSKFNSINDLFSNRHKHLHEEYIGNLENDFKRNPTNFWNFVNGHRKSSSLPCKLNYKDKSATSNEEKANLFAEHFSSVYIKGQRNDMDTEQFIHSRIDNNCFNVMFSPESIKFILKTMDLNKGQGPDRIPPIFLRECNDILSNPIHYA